MNFLSLFVLIPILTMGGLFLSKNLQQIRVAVATGASLLLALAVGLVFAYLGERGAGNTAEMLFTADTVWYAPLNIHYSVGVDGISVAMLLLSAVIVFTGTFASWKMDFLQKEYFLWFNLLAIGVFGFFISVDLFTMFMFYEVALIPMYLLIGVWGSGKKGIRCHETDVDADGRLCPAARGNSWHLLPLLDDRGAHDELAGNSAGPRHARKPAALVLPVGIHRVRGPRGIIPVPYMVTRRSRLCPHGSLHAPCRGIDETGWLRVFPGSHLPDAGGR